MILTLLASFLLTGCTATDGDTIRCGSERIRLLGIDAPEMPGHCRRGRVCAPGDPVRSKATIAAMLRRGPVTITRTGRDRYGRTLALVSVNGRDLSCEQLRGGLAIYKPQWDTGGRLRSICT
ncbi:nuclease [Sphingomonas sp. Leaf17]|uniref:thermonuclease family protein n=1 Tax=Sphingomonas sp. Leaf17 TaxID=1735683 RepID=UPI0006F55FD5|nr:thermonuclease family protein [Sphingomonas sp. Leaf17]KQM65809.1 nuclease [Sphingomonas sp. Leaf17]